MPVVNPASLEAPIGFSHGIVTPAGGRLLFVAGQTAVSVDGFVGQFDGALLKILEVTRTAGGRPDQIARMTIYVTDMEKYLAARQELRNLMKATGLEQALAPLDVAA